MSCEFCDVSPPDILTWYRCECSLLGQTPRPSPPIEDVVEVNHSTPQPTVRGKGPAVHQRPQLLHQLLRIERTLLLRQETEGRILDQVLQRVELNDRLRVADHQVVQQKVQVLLPPLRPDNVHQNLDGRLAHRHVAVVRGVGAEDRPATGQVAHPLEVANRPQTAHRHHVLVTGEQLVQVEAARNLLQNALRVRREHVHDGRRRGRPRDGIKNGRNGHRSDRLRQGIDQRRSIVGVGEGILRVVIVLEEVKEKAQHLRGADAVQGAQAGHRPEDGHLQEVVLKVTEVVHSDDVRTGGRAKELAKLGQQRRRPDPAGAHQVGHPREAGSGLAADPVEGRLAGDHLEEGVPRLFGVEAVQHRQRLHLGDDVPLVAQLVGPLVVGLLENDLPEERHLRVDAQPEDR
ncbi:hypothetical protein TYRP_013698 [Tyrophagus putrescentiae]|nr:hypothetical protein TYRP_013698 [Tyrophagus putrescentiae]